MVQPTQFEATSSEFTIFDIPFPGGTWVSIDEPSILQPITEMDYIHRVLVSYYQIFTGPGPNLENEAPQTFIWGDIIFLPQAGKYWVRHDGKGVGRAALSFRCIPISRAEKFHPGFRAIEGPGPSIISPLGTILADRTVWCPAGVTAGGLHVAAVGGAILANPPNTQAAVVVGAASVVVLAGNIQRTGALLINDSTDDIYLSIAAAPVAVVGLGVLLHGKGANYQIDGSLPTRKAVAAISTGAASNLLVNEQGF